MNRPVDDGPHDQVPLLPGERFEVALDAQLGVVGSSATGENILTVTTHRAILLSSEPGKRTTALLPLSKLTGIEVVDVYRATERLPQGLLLLGAGVLFGWLSWTLVSVVLISLLVGGLPVLAAIYILTGWALPDQDGALVLHAGDYSLRHVLRSADARRDAHLVAQRLYELASAAGSEPAAVVPSEAASPQAEQAPLWPSVRPIMPFGLVPEPLSDPPSEPAIAPPAAATDAGGIEAGSAMEEAPQAADEQTAPEERGTVAPPSPWQPS
ncbi:MAG: hypothetical protein IIC94_00415 [Chloroflexi bacterium]|nr:hypothetical protein [Chloroflexota bacterium]